MLLGLAASVLQAASIISFCDSVLPADLDFECVPFRGGDPVILVNCGAPACVFDNVNCSLTLPSIKKRAVDAREAKVPKVYEAQARAIDALFDVTPGESGSMLSALDACAFQRRPAKMLRLRLKIVL